MSLIKMKLKTGGSWIQIFPETTVDQISDAGTVGKKLLKDTQTRTVASFIKVAVNGDISWRTPAEVLSDIGAAPLVHGHVISDVTGLVAALLLKADLDVTDPLNPVVQTGQIPTFVIGGLKFKEAISTTTFDMTTDFLSTKGIISSSAPQMAGTYFVITNALGCNITFGTNTDMEAPGDEGDSDSEVHLEVGDWLVFKGYSAGTFMFGVINNTYREADENSYGIVRISSTIAVNRAGLSSNFDASKVVDEKTLRQVMKDIYYVDDVTVGAPVTALNGDIAFEY